MAPPPADNFDLFTDDTADQQSDGFIDDTDSERSAKKLKRFLRDTEKRMGLLLELMPIGLALHQEQSIVFANQALANLVGCSAEALIGRHCLDFIETDDPLDMFNKFATVFSADQTLNEPDLKIIGEDGESHTVQLIVGRMPWDGVPLAQVIIQDVSHLKAMEHELMRQSAELASALYAESKARRTQKEFVSVVRHEFRTPLAIIDGSAQMIERALGAGKPERAKEKAGKIRRAVTRMNGLIDDILVTSSLEHSQYQVSIEDLDMAAFIEDRCAQMEEAAENHTILRQIEALPTTIPADRRACSHIFDNLLSNAMKYSPDETQIIVRAWQADELVYVSVQDFGVGVPAEEMDKLFNQYFRASTARGISGTGIGLNLAKNLLRIQGGDITVESTVGVGSTFSFHLPLAGIAQVEE